MFFIIIRLFILQIYFIRFYHSAVSFEHLSFHYILSNSSIALNQCQKQFSSLNIYDQCNLLLTNTFHHGIGTCIARCLNQTRIHHNTMQFDIIITFINGTFSFYSRTCFTCVFNNSCDSTFINDWIHWQNIAMNETTRANSISNKKDNIRSKDFRIYGSAYNSTIQLCTNFATRIHKRDSNTNITSSIITDNNDPDSYVEEMTSCSRYDYRHINVTNKIYYLMRQVMDSAEISQAANNQENNRQEKVVSTVKYRETSFRNKLLKIVIIFISIILVIVLFLLLIVCLVHRNNYRQGYLSADTSTTL
ncbi:hypothetical protein I4U23_020217 [Adineta vaga]|nr:hypothetical protein I4U23_020217 [Adineta vaga]